MKAAFVFAIVLAFAGAQPASARYLERATANDHLPWSCDVVIWAANHFTEAQLREMAKSSGVSLTPRQKAEARACFNK